MKNIYIILGCLFSVVSLVAQEPLTLSESIKRGLTQSFDLEVSRGVVDIAKEQNSWSAAGAYPTLKFALAGDVLSDMSSSNFGGDIGLSTEWALFDGFVVRSRKSLLSSNEEFNVGVEMLEIENAIKNIIGSYYYVVMMQRNVAVALEVYELSQDRYAHVQDAVALGSSGTYQLIQAESALLEDNKRYLGAKLSFRDAMTSLNRVLSEPNPSKNWMLVDSLSLPEGNYDLLAMEQKMLDNNITLKNQYINQQARELEIKEVQSDYYPRLSLGAGVYNDLSSGDFGANIGLSLAYNIFNNGQTRRNTSIAKIVRDVEVVKGEHMSFVLRNSLSMINDQYTAYHSMVGVAARQVAVARLNLELSTERYRSGAISSFNFRDVQMEFMQSSLEELQVIYDLLMVNLEMLQITGGILNKYN